MQTFPEFKKAFKNALLTTTSLTAPVVFTERARTFGLLPSQNTGKTL